MGLATAYRLLCRYPCLELDLFEKEDGPARHQSGHNSGVLHSGLYYRPGSAKARLAVRGIRRMVEFCAEHGVAYELCGKIVVAADQGELPRLHALLERGTRNGLEGLELLGPEQMREIEPHAGGVAAIRVPQEGIVDYPGVARAMAAAIGRMGGRIHLSSGVSRLARGTRWRIETAGGGHEADLVVNCAGLHSDRVCRKAGDRDPARIVPFRGEYYCLREGSRHLVRHLIYPVPDPRFPFLGVHFTRMIRGGVEAGPNAVLAFAREGYRPTDLSLRDMVETLTYRGFWRFLLRYPGMCWEELRRSFSKELFCRSLRRLVPEIGVADLEAGGSGVRAQSLTPDGGIVDDFRFVRSERALHVLNAPSPAATASLAIADEIIAQATDLLPGKAVPVGA